MQETKIGNSQAKNKSLESTIQNLQTKVSSELRKIEEFDVAYFVTDLIKKPKISLDFINDLNTKNIKINVHQYTESQFMDIKSFNPYFYSKFDVIILGGSDDVNNYYQITDVFIESLVMYRNFGGSILFLHDFNSGKWSNYGKRIEPFSSELGFSELYGWQDRIYTSCKFVRSNMNVLKFPFQINDTFDVSPTHETTAYDSKYKIIESSDGKYHYYSENSQKRIADCCIGHSFNINNNEKKLLYNIIYHLSKLNK